jgi:hypothetical protein
MYTETITDPSSIASNGALRSMAIAANRASSSVPLALRASTCWGFARPMFTNGRVNCVDLKYQRVGVLPAALLYALRVINECKCLLGRLGYHPDLLRALIYAR